MIPIARYVAPSLVSHTHTHTFPSTSRVVTRYCLPPCVFYLPLSPCIVEPVRLQVVCPSLFITDCWLQAPLCLLTFPKVCWQSMEFQPCVAPLGPGAASYERAYAHHTHTGAYSGVKAMLAAAPPDPTARTVRVHPRCLPSFPALNLAAWPLPHWLYGTERDAGAARAATAGAGRDVAHQPSQSIPFRGLREGGRSRGELFLLFSINFCLIAASMRLAGRAVPAAGRQGFDYDTSRPCLNRLLPSAASAGARFSS